MKIKIAHLYYDLLNLYGENGNIIALKDSFLKQNVKCEIDLLSIGDDIDFKKYDLYYIGSGSDENLLIALNDIKRHVKGLENAIKNNKYIISTGNSQELFGKFIELNNQKYEALGIFNYYAKQNSKRIVGQSFMDFDNLKTIIGFQNRKNVIQRTSNHLFDVVYGFADNYKSSSEGHKENNFFGTYLLGPLLIRNPHLTDHIVKCILEEKKLPYKKDTNTFEYKAYNEYIKNFYDL